MGRVGTRGEVQVGGLEMYGKERSECYFTYSLGKMTQLLFCL